MKRTKQLVTIQETADQLHRRLLGAKWYIRTAVMSTPPPANAPVGNKRESKTIVVYVRDMKDVQDQSTTYNGWPVRYELGV